MVKCFPPDIVVLLMRLFPHYDTETVDLVVQNNIKINLKFKNS